MKENLVKSLTVVWRVVRWPFLVIESFALLFLLREIEGTPTWELLDLLIIPAVLAVGVWWLNKTQREAEREEAEKNWEEERWIAQNRQEQETLESYFDRMTELLLAEKLRERSLNEEEPEVQTIARARTLAVLRNLRPERKGYVVQFLYEAGLFDRKRPIISLTVADLIEIYLPRPILPRADLSGAVMTGAFLPEANLSGIDLSGTNLGRANLIGANLSRADLGGANLARIRLRGALYDRETIWPERFDPEAAGAILVDEEGNPVEDENEQ